MMVRALRRGYSSLAEVQLAGCEFAAGFVGQVEHLASFCSMAALSTSSGCAPLLYGVARESGSSAFAVQLTH